MFFSLTPVSSNIKDCRKRGGECVPKRMCGRAPTHDDAPCPDGHVCCIFLN